MAQRTSSRPTPAAPVAAPARERLVAAVLLGAVAGAVLVGLAWLLLPGSEPATESRAPTMEERVAQLAAERSARDEEVFDALVGTTTTVVDDLLPVLTAMATAMPLDGSAGPVADAEPWVTAARDAQAALEATDTADTGTNKARLAFIEATRLLGLAADTYGDAQGLDAAARDEALARAAELRASAAGVWEIGAIQLDESAVATDRGHIHLYLPLDGSAEDADEHH